MQGNSYQMGLVALKDGKVQLAKKLFTVSNDSRAKDQLARLEKRKSEQMISACIITKNNQATIEECLLHKFLYISFYYLQFYPTAHVFDNNI